MDGSAVEHSDSDSGESWTLLESCPTFGDDAPDFGDHPAATEGYAVDNTERDEDTDGISIISDSDPESATPCDLNFDKSLLDESRPADPQIPEFVSINTQPLNNNDDNESVKGGDEDFLGDSNAKLKTYVHKRNKRLSTMLNIIVLGSVITAAGVAVGHIWGARNDCPVKAVPSVNKILSNLYKLQEENAYLRSKIRELTLINNIHMQHRKTDEKVPMKLHKCKKLFEESLTNENADKLIKCVDNDTTEKLIDSHMIDHHYEKDFLNDLDKLKNVYQQNKSWLDEEIAKRLKNEEQNIKKIKINNLKSPKSTKINKDVKSLKTKNLERQTSGEPPTNTETVINVTELVQNQEAEAAPEKIITYADSLKSGHKVVKRDARETNVEKKFRDKKRTKAPKEFGTVSETSLTDDELVKDDRYAGPKYKPDRKKNDRHKIHKKQKRRNKYEQWEMKGGYMKDYDDFSIPSSHEYEVGPKNSERSAPRPADRRGDAADYRKRADSDTEDKSKAEKRAKGDKGNEGKVDWYSARAALRTEARRKLEQELFAGAAPPPAAPAPAPAPAAWYFRRGARRDQCRRDNSTQRRHAASRRLMNYKTKH